MASDKICSLLILKRTDTDGNDEVLLAMKKRGFGAGLWNGVGGKVDPGETMEQAMVRESQEEIDVTPTVYEKVAEHDFLMDVDTHEPWHMHVHAYTCTKWEGEPAETEEMAPQWFAVHDIPYDKMWQDDIVWLPQVLLGRKLEGNFSFNGDNSMVRAEFNIIQ